MLAATLITPLPPTDANGSVSESSPEIIVISHWIAISLAWSRLPVASFIATIFWTYAKRGIVSGVMPAPHRPGMLYRTMGRSTSSAIALKC